MTETIIPKSFKLLVIEDYQPDANQTLQATLVSNKSSFEPVFAHDFKEALNYLNQITFDVILTDLYLPDNSGLDTFLKLYLQVPEVPIVVATTPYDKTLAVEVIREGAQDYLGKEEIDYYKLERALFFAIERNRTLSMLKYLSLTDELTGLLNRRGFLSLAQQHVKIAQRSNWDILLLFADLDELKEINDNFGHPEGDQALRSVAQVLRETFRTSDVIARLGGDEFIILAINVSATGVEVITQRLEENLERLNVNNEFYNLKLSYGIARFRPDQKDSIEEMVAQADRALYEHKNSRRKD